MHSNIVVRLRIDLTSRIIGACIGCIATTAYANEPLTAPFNSSGSNGMRLHMAQSLLTKPKEKVTIPGQALDLVWTDEECLEGDSAGLPMAASGIAAASQHSAEPLNMTLAKYEPSAASGSNRSRSVDVPDLVLGAMQSKQTTTAAQPKPAPTPAPAAVPAAEPVKQAASWEIIPSDKTLNTSLARWASAAGWQLVWELPIDYAVEARTTVPGTFEEAVETVAKSMETAEIPMRAIFYKGNKVLRIVARGGE